MTPGNAALDQKGAGGEADRAERWSTTESERDGNIPESAIYSLIVDVYLLILTEYRLSTEK